MLLIPTRRLIVPGAPRAIRPPDDPERWWHWADQLAQQLHVDVQRLWRRSGVAPQPWIGGAGRLPAAAPGTFTTITTTTPGEGCECAEMPATWTLTVAGISNATCTTCADYNGTFTLGFVSATQCLFETAEAATCATGSEFRRWRLFRSTDGGTVIVAAMAKSDVGGMAEFRLALGDFNCFGPNTLPLALTTTNCNFPSSVDLAPL